MPIRTFAVAALFALTACAAPPTTGEASVSTFAAVPGFVTDQAAFEQFIATGPTPEAFRARYPDVLLVLPGSIASKEFRMNNSRYFAELDAEGRIRGGRFQ